MRVTILMRWLTPLPFLMIGWLFLILRILEPLPMSGLQAWRYNMLEGWLLGQMKEGNRVEEVVVSVLVGGFIVGATFLLWLGLPWVFFHQILQVPCPKCSQPMRMKKLDPPLYLCRACGRVADDGTTQRLILMVPDYSRKPHSRARFPGR